MNNVIDGFRLVCCNVQVHRDRSETQDGQEILVHLVTRESRERKDKSATLEQWDSRVSLVQPDGRGRLVSLDPRDRSASVVILASLASREDLEIPVHRVQLVTWATRATPESSARLEGRVIPGNRASLVWSDLPASVDPRA